MVKIEGWWKSGGNWNPEKEITLWQQSIQRLSPQAIPPYRSTRCMPRLPHLPTSIIRSAKKTWGHLQRETQQKNNKKKKKKKKKKNNTNNKNKNDKKKTQNNTNNKNKNDNKKTTLMTTPTTITKTITPLVKTTPTTVRRTKTTTRRLITTPTTKTKTTTTKNQNNNNNEIWISCPAEVWNAWYIFYLSASISQNPRWGFQGTARQGPRRTWNPPRWDSSQRYATPQTTNSQLRDT